jgi:hypothetical protein
MDIEAYWDTIDLKSDELFDKGFIKLPSIKLLNIKLDTVIKNILHEMGDKTYSELDSTHKKFLNEIGVYDHLSKKLYDFAKNRLSYKGDIKNQYHVARRVVPGNFKESHRAHFDSHLFTIVIPLQIPEKKNNQDVGDLIFFPNARKSPKIELFNLFQKLWYKKYASKDGIKAFSKFNKLHQESFTELEPLLFIGNTTLHTNKLVPGDANCQRLTLLAHFFDPSPKYGVGSILRLIRGR